MKSHLQKETNHPWSINPTISTYFPLNESSEWHWVIINPLSSPLLPYQPLFWGNYNNLTATSLEWWFGVGKLSPNGLISASQLLCWFPMVAHSPMITILCNCIEKPSSWEFPKVHRWIWNQISVINWPWIPYWPIPDISAGWRPAVTAAPTVPGTAGGEVWRVVWNGVFGNMEICCNYISNFTMVYRWYIELDIGLYNPFIAAFGFQKWR